MTKERLLYVDYVKALAMILVIIGHVNFANQDIKAWIYSFHMPVFFFCTGLVLNRGNEPFSFRKSIVGKFHRLMMPYLLWAMIFAKLTISNLGKIVYGSYQSISSSGSLTSLWFLPVMYVALVIFYIIVSVKILNQIWIKVLFALFAVILGMVLPHLKVGYPLGFNVGLVALAFLLGGSLLRPIFDCFFQFCKENKRYGILSCLSVALLMGIGTLAYQLNLTDAGYVLMAKLRIGCVGLFLFVALSGILMLLSFCMFLELCQVKGYRWLLFIGQNTLCIFAVHKPIISCFKMFFQHIQVPDLTVLLVTTLGTLILSCCMCVIVNKYIPVFAGRQ